MGQAIEKREREAAKLAGEALPQPAWTPPPEQARAPPKMVVETTGPEDEPAPHYSPSVRGCDVERSASASCGFHLSRTQWDPYPWVSGVEAGSAAEAAGLLSGDCVLEVNGEDVLGLKICDVAEKVKARADRVSLLLWNSGSDPNCDPESLCCGPMTTSLQRLTTSVSAILAALECPVCLDTIPPPAHQCCNGHLICVRCRARAERCPVCRVRFSRGRSLLADRVFSSLTDAFGVAAAPELRRKLCLRPQEPREAKAAAPRNKFLARVLGKSCSVENLSPRRQGLLAPHRDDEDFAGLKAKSLSTGEIFRPHSPAPVSRWTSASSTQLSASGAASCESLEDCGDDPPCFCPSDAACRVAVRASRVLQHVRECHDGPLVQYFRPRACLALPSPLEDTALVSLADGSRAFFLKVAQPAAAHGDTLVWLWFVGSARGAAAHSLHVTLRGHGARGKLLHFRADALSLAADSWADVAASQRGVVRLPARALIDSFATELETGIAIAMDVEVKVAGDP
ncbi:uncharacterized protein LOC134530319 [Bacillus rossius redtenbacheri]|uniref:uncharacterized protein LOC134530319 n=1 Tax=Bacillus rossius redtenbacheri TaxID=93214 RepID=UPI002FDDE77B